MLALWLLHSACAQSPAGVRRIADRVWVFDESAGAPDAPHGNGGFIVGPRGVLVIDAGVSLAEGTRRLELLRAATDQPIRALLLTHAGQEFIFGATAFQQAGVPVIMHLDAARLMAARCERCLKNLNRELGEAAMAGSRVPKPELTFASPTELAAALPDIGVPLQLIYGETGASPGACAVFVEPTRTLFAGALLAAQAVPELQDADLPSWQRLRARLRELDARQIVPGHGPVGGSEIIDALEAYLTDLTTAVAAFVHAGHPLSAAADGIELPRYQSWLRYDTTHRRNASILYLRRERELLINP